MNNDNNALEQRYGLWTAVSMVVGIVIGSGVFFKAEKILVATNGNLMLGVLAWIIGGLIMLSGTYSFSILAQKISNINGIVDYAEFALGKKYGYFVGLTIGLVTYPTLCAVVSWIAARYIAVLFAFENVDYSAEVFFLATFILVFLFALNVFAPNLSGKLQISRKIIKIIPLIAISIFGIIFGISSGQTIENFNNVSTEIMTDNPLFSSIVATAFAYEGWIIATSINSELRNPKRDLPIALVFGSIVIILIYVLYFIGLTGSMPINDLISGGENAVKAAYTTLLGSIGGSALFVFVIISCLGTLNGLAIATSRAMYSLAVRGLGFAPKMLKNIDDTSKMPTNSAFIGLLVCLIWQGIWLGNYAGWWPIFFDVSELPIMTTYAVYIPIFLWMIFKYKDMKKIDRFAILPFACLGSMFMIYAVVVSHGFTATITYLILFTAIMLSGYLIQRHNEKDTL